MTYFIKSHNHFSIASKDAIDISETLPSSVYMLKEDQYKNLYLETLDIFTLPPVFYGDVNSTTDRIINTFNRRSSSTGVLLVGEKGSGKTILSKNVSNHLIKQGVPTIIINSAYCDDKFSSFIQSIEQPCLFLFDEFEKVYHEKEAQEKLLTLLDGLLSTKKLFIFTCNDVYRVNSHMINRPGRIFYTIKYHGLSKEFIEEYCQSNLNDVSHIENICKLSLLFEAFNFDLLQALVEDMNRYNETPQQVLKYLNATVDNNETRYNITKLVVGGKNIKISSIEDGGEWIGNPLNPNGINVEYYNNADDEDDASDALLDALSISSSNTSSGWVKINIPSASLASINTAQGVFIFETPATKDGLVLEKRQNKFFNFNMV